MQIEYGYHDLASNEQETKTNLDTALNYPIDAVSVLPYYTKLAKNCVANKPVKIGSLIDYPTGSSDLNSRLQSSKNAIKNGANILQITVPVSYLCNRKYDKFREDISNHMELCADGKTEVRYILEYRLFSYEMLYKITQILLGYKVYSIYPSSGYFIDDIYDNILAAALINKKIPDINIICNGNLWNSNQISVLEKHNLYGLKVHSIHVLDMLFKNLAKI